MLVPAMSVVAIVVGISLAISLMSSLKNILFGAEIIFVHRISSSFFVFVLGLVCMFHRLTCFASLFYTHFWDNVQACTFSKTVGVQNFSHTHKLVMFISLKRSIVSVKLLGEGTISKFRHTQTT